MKAERKNDPPAQQEERKPIPSISNEVSFIVFVIASWLLAFRGLLRSKTAWPML